MDDLDLWISEIKSQISQMTPLEKAELQEAVTQLAQDTEVDAHMTDLHLRRRNIVETRVFRSACAVISERRRLWLGGWHEDLLQIKKLLEG